MLVDRRRALSLLGALACSSFWPARARAGYAMGLTLEQLSRGSQAICVAAAIEATSHWTIVAGARHIVTDVRVLVDDVIAGTKLAAEPVLVRTLGGAVGRTGERVSGEALLVVGEPAVLFITPETEGIRTVMGMAQGHFPLRTQAPRVLRLTQSPQLSDIMAAEHSAVRRLTGRTLAEARILIREARG
jgi:hypothetical protein